MKPRTFFFWASLLLIGACATGGGDMSVREFLNRYPTGASDDLVTVKGPVIEELNSRTFAMGNGSDVILVVHAGNEAAALGTKGWAGSTVVVTGEPTLIRRGDPPFIDDTVKAMYLNKPGVVATRVQVVDF